jgi:endogenous inhibitor of DNA gyrase (YacG/DUF329 family)
MDLGAWASESYRIPVVEMDDLDDDALGMTGESGS